MFLSTLCIEWSSLPVWSGSDWKLCCVCPAFDLWGDRAGILINAVMTAEILYYRPLPPHYSPLTFSAPRLE